MATGENVPLSIPHIVPKPIEPSPCCSRGNPSRCIIRQDCTSYAANGAEILLEVRSVLGNIIVHKLGKFGGSNAYFRLVSRLAGKDVFN